MDERSIFSTNKFHNVLFELGVALQATVSPDTDIVPVSSEYSYPDLIHRNPKETVVRIHYPSFISYNNLKKVKEIKFFPWVNPPVNQFELIFRNRPFERNSDSRRRIFFAREGEDHVFTFKNNSGIGFLPLDFFTEHVSIFRTLYIATQTDPKNNKSSIQYHKFDASLNEKNEIIAVVCEVDKEFTPHHMQNFV